jgi:uncharacterized protein (TIGR00297 family)
MTPLPQLLPQMGLGLLFSGLIAFVAYRRASLDMSGALGAVITGTAIFGFGGWSWGALLITFFVLSTLLSKFKARAKEALAEKFAKGSRRDLGQVLANGGAGTLLALTHALVREPATRTVLLFAFAGAMATVNADTWATELGVLSRRPPRLITSGQVVEPGTSGGISALGTLATFAGGLAMGGAASGYHALDGLLGSAAALPGAALIVAGILGGLTGSFFDSLLGATVQAIYYSESRAKETERPVDPDGVPNRLLRGHRRLNNDWVNFLSSLVGAAAGAVVYIVMR